MSAIHGAVRRGRGWICQGCLVAWLVGTAVGAGTGAQSQPARAAGPAAAGGVTARFVPGEVRPGDLFSLLVEMERADYARFELQVPTHERLHRVAVESVPVVHENGRYVQRERWVLQADASGEVVIDGATVRLESARGETVLALPPLRVAVVPYARNDPGDDPQEWPADEVRAASVGLAHWWWSVPVLALALGLILWLRRSIQPVDSGDQPGETAIGLVLRELDAGRLDSSALEQWMDAEGAGWPRELRQLVGEAVYAGRGDPEHLADLLRKEVAR